MLPLEVIPLPKCRWRGAPVAVNRFGCSSPKLVVGRRGVLAQTCQKCYCVDHEPVVSAEPARVVAPPPTSGPGTELKALLASVGVHPDSCVCNAHAEQMDRWQVAGCREHREEIAHWLREESGKRRWWWQKATASALELLGADPFGWLVDESIRRAEEKEKVT